MFRYASVLSMRSDKRPARSDKPSRKDNDKLKHIGHQELTYWLRLERALIIYLSSSKKSLLYNAFEDLSLIRCQLVTMLDVVWIDAQFLVRVPDNQVSVGPFGNHPFVTRQTYQFRWCST